MTHPVPTRLPRYPTHPHYKDQKYKHFPCINPISSPSPALPRHFPNLSYSMLTHPKLYVLTMYRIVYINILPIHGAKNESKSISECIASPAVALILLPYPAFSCHFHIIPYAILPRPTPCEPAPYRPVYLTILPSRGAKS